jgi:hypothetical protein
VSRAFFDDAVDALVGFLPPRWRRFSSRVTSRNLKVWYSDEGREHYEMQLLPKRRLEIGFHAEHRDRGRNEAVLARIVELEPRWRPALGDEVVLGPFVGAGPRVPWRRASEVWDGVDVDERDTAVEAAERLSGYIGSLEPLRAT